MKIKFTTDYTPKDNSGIIYKEGQIVDLPKASAEHFLKRNLAVHVLSLKKEDEPLKALGKGNEGQRKKKRGRPPLQP